MDKLYLFCEKSVDLCNELVCICAVNSASHFNAFAACGRATEAVHTDLKEELSCFGSHIKNITDDGILCYLHFKILQKYKYTTIIILSGDALVNTFFAFFRVLLRENMIICIKFTKKKNFFLCALQKIYKFLLVM